MSSPANLNSHCTVPPSSPHSDTEGRDGASLLGDSRKRGYGGDKSQKEPRKQLRHIDSMAAVALLLALR